MQQAKEDYAAFLKEDMNLSAPGAYIIWPEPNTPPINLYNAPKQTGVKYDKDKPRIDLVDADFLEGLGRVLAFGANKYAANNWRNGLSYSRLIGAAYRHLGAINKGEDNDPETGLSHAYHLGCCTMFLASMMNHRPDLDDRYKETK